MMKRVIALIAGCTTLLTVASELVPINQQPSFLIEARSFLNEPLHRAGITQIGRYRMSGLDDYFDLPEDKKMALAVSQGDVSAIRRMISRGEVSPHKIGRRNMNWVSIAVLTRQKKALDALLELGALGDSKGKIAGSSMYHATIIDDGLPYLERLHRAGADLNQVSSGELLIVTALFTGDPVKLQFYIDKGADISASGPGRESPAYSAAMVNNFAAVNMFLDLGADPWTMAADGATLGLVAEEQASVPAMVPGSPNDQERLKLLARLHAIGFPNPAPTPQEGRAMLEAGTWPPPNVSRTSPPVK